MKKQLVHALKTKYDADYQMHKANLAKFALCI